MPLIVATSTAHALYKEKTLLSSIGNLTLEYLPKMKFLCVILIFLVNVFESCALAFRRYFELPGYRLLYVLMSFTHCSFNLDVTFHLSNSLSITFYLDDSLSFRTQLSCHTLKEAFFDPILSFKSGLNVHPTFRLIHNYCLCKYTVLLICILNCEPFDLGSYAIYFHISST